MLNLFVIAGGLAFFLATDPDHHQIGRIRETKKDFNQQETKSNMYI